LRSFGDSTGSYDVVYKTRIDYPKMIVSGDFFYANLGDRLEFTVTGLKRPKNEDDIVDSISDWFEGRIKNVRAPREPMWSPLVKHIKLLADTYTGESDSNIVIIIATDGQFQYPDKDGGHSLKFEPGSYTEGVKIIKKRIEDNGMKPFNKKYSNMEVGLMGLETKDPSFIRAQDEFYTWLFAPQPVLLRRF